MCEYVLVRYLTLVRAETETTYREEVMYKKRENALPYKAIFALAGKQEEGAAPLAPLDTPLIVSRADCRDYRRVGARALYVHDVDQRERVRLDARLPGGR